MNKDLIISKLIEAMYHVGGFTSKPFTIEGAIDELKFTVGCRKCHKLAKELSLLQEQEEKVQRLKEILKEKKVSSNLSDAEKAELFELEQQLDIPYKDRFYHNDNPKQTESVDQSGIREELIKFAKVVYSNSTILKPEEIVDNYLKAKER